MLNINSRALGANHSTALATACIALLALFCLPITGWAIDTIPGGPRFDHISRSDGLSNASVSSIVQDRRGFIWFGTQGGLNRYDGLGVKAFEHDPFDPDSLPHNLIQTMYLDPDDEVIWIGTYRGLSRFDIETERFVNYPQQEEGGLSDDVVTSVVKGPHSAVWVGTLDGLNRLDPRTGEIRRIDGLPHQTVRSLHVDRAGRLWVGTYGGLSSVDPAVGTVTSTVTDEDGLPSLFVMAIHQVQDEELWLGLWDGGLVRYEIDSGMIETTRLADDRVYVVAGQDRIVAGTWGGGLFFYEPESGLVDHFVHEGEDDYGLSHNIVYSLLYDDAGVLWIGTNGNGVNRLSNTKRNYLRFKHVPDDPDTLSEGKVTAIARDISGVLWIGTYTGGLNRWDPVAGRMVRYRNDPDDPHSLSNDIVTSIFEDSSGALWVTTNDGLNRYDRGLDQFDRFYHDPSDENSIADNITYCMAEDAEGGLWIGTYSAGVSRFDPEAGTYTHYRNRPGDPTSLSDDLVYTMIVDSADRLWIGTNNGLNRYDPNRDEFVRYLHDENDRSALSSNTVRVLREGRPGRLWIGTVSGGVNIMDVESGRFSHITKRDGLPDNTVVGILQDGRDRMWLATLFGISIVEPDIGVIRNLDEEDGLAGMEFNSGHLRDSDGDLVFGGPHGISVFTEELLSENAHAPPVHILSVTAGAGIVSQPTAGMHIDLSYDDASLSLEFVALDYEAPSKNIFRYKLMGFDDHWTDSGNRNFAAYTNLPPGSYTFVVQGANNDGFWGRVPATLEVSVSFPPWLRWWAFLLYGVALFLVYVVAVRIREGRLLRARVEELTQTRERLQIANARLEALSVEDGLTGVFNRRYLDARIDEEVRRAERSGTPLAILLVDVDRFKAYNDAYGHTAGDECLKVIAETLNESVNRVADCVARYGGEEFCIVLPQTEIDGARAVARRFADGLRRRGIRHEASDVSDLVTVSIGICGWTPDSGRGPKDLLTAADSALYRAKEGGRNRIESCE